MRVNRMGIGEHGMVVKAQWAVVIGMRVENQQIHLILQQLVRWYQELLPPMQAVEFLGVSGMG